MRYSSSMVNPGLNASGRYCFCLLPTAPASCFSYLRNLADTPSGYPLNSGCASSARTKGGSVRWVLIRNAFELGRSALP